MKPEPNYHVQHQMADDNEDFSHKLWMTAEEFDEVVDKKFKDTKDGLTQKCSHILDNFSDLYDDYVKLLDKLDGVRGCYNKLTV